MLRHKAEMIILIILGIICFGYYMVIHLRGITFSVFFFLLSMVLICSGIGGILFSQSNVIKKLFPLLKLFKIAIFALIFSFLAVEAAIIYYGSSKSIENTDYIIILGAGVRGLTPSQILYERLRAGLVCISNNPDALVILSGGKGPGEDISEAEAMRRFLTLNGVDEKRIILEDKSRDTRQNILFSKQKIEERSKNKGARVIIVTSNFHAFRAGFLARRAGLNAHSYSAPIPDWLIPTYYVREYIAVLKSYFLDRVL